MFGRHEERISSSFATSPVSCCMPHTPNRKPSRQSLAVPLLQPTPPNSLCARTHSLTKPPTLPHPSSVGRKSSLAADLACNSRLDVSILGCFLNYPVVSMLGKITIWWTSSTALVFRCIAHSRATVPRCRKDQTPILTNQVVALVPRGRLVFTAKTTCKGSQEIQRISDLVLAKVAMVDGAGPPPSFCPPPDPISPLPLIHHPSFFYQPNTFPKNRFLFNAASITHVVWQLTYC